MRIQESRQCKPDVHYQSLDVKECSEKSHKHIVLFSRILIIFVPIIKMNF